MVKDLVIAECKIVGGRLQERFPGESRNDARPEALEAKKTAR
jgi:hypothetical protein